MGETGYLTGEHNYVILDRKGRSYFRVNYDIDQFTIPESTTMPYISVTRTEEGFTANIRKHSKPEFRSFEFGVMTIDRSCIPIHTLFYKINRSDRVCE